MARVENLTRLQAKLQALKTGADVSVQVGFTQRYALYVHEDLEAAHAEGKTAKYLEGPARRLKTELARLATDTYAKTKSMTKALLVAGLRLQREAQQIVPVDTGALKASAYTALEAEADAKAGAAFAKALALETKKKSSRLGRSKKKRDRQLLASRKKRFAKEAASQEKKRKK